MQNFTLPQELIALIHAIRNAGGRALLVGGIVRDQLLGQNLNQDYDVEVFGLEVKELETILNQAGKVMNVGKKFGVLKLNTIKDTYDFSIPRIERKTGKGHKNFEITTNSSLQYREAASRRDFTINSMGYDPLNGNFFDPFMGLDDLNKKRLKHIGVSFSEDPLRVFRAMQFSGRFEFTIVPETIQLCRKLNLSELPKERIFKEFRKLLLSSQSPSIGLESARQLGILEYFPELKSLVGFIQDSERLPDVDAWSQTLKVVDAAAKLKQKNIRSNLILMLAALCLDLSKPISKNRLDQSTSNKNQSKLDSVCVETLLKRLTEEKDLILRVKNLVLEQYQPLQLYENCYHSLPSGVLRLALRVPIDTLVRLTEAKHRGYIFYQSKSKKFPEGDWLLKHAKLLKVVEGPPKPILMGKHLNQRGISSGQKMGILLNKAFEAQINGEFQTLQEAKYWVDKELCFPIIESLK